MNGQEIIPRDLQDLVDREMEPGEVVRWIEQPIPRYFTPASTGAFLFAIPWTGFALFWICGAAGFQIPNFANGGFSLFPLFGIPFVLIGFGMLSTPLWTRRAARKTVYVVTDRRAIIIDGGRTTTIRSYPPERLQDMHRRERRDGSGDVILDQRIVTGSESQTMNQNIGFFNIREPKAVESLLRDLAGLAQPRANA